jgi:hypothetical protein
MESPTLAEEPPYASAQLARWRAVTDAPLLILAIGSLPLLLLETMRADLPRADRLFLDIVNVVVLVAFAVDYAVELRLAQGKRSFVGGEWTSLLIVAAQAVALIPSLTGLGVLRVLRVGRVWRGVGALMRAVAVGGVAARQGRRIVRRHAAGFALSVAALAELGAKPKPAAASSERRGG